MSIRDNKFLEQQRKRVTAAEQSFKEHKDSFEPVVAERLAGYLMAARSYLNNVERLYDPITRVIDKKVNPQNKNSNNYYDQNSAELSTYPTAINRLHKKLSVIPGVVMGALFLTTIGFTIGGANPFFWTTALRLTSYGTGGAIGVAAYNVAHKALKKSYNPAFPSKLENRAIQKQVNRQEKITRDYEKLQEYIDLLLGQNTPLDFSKIRLSGIPVLAKSKVKADLKEFNEQTLSLNEYLKLFEEKIAISCDEAKIKQTAASRNKIPSTTVEKVPTIPATTVSAKKPIKHTGKTQGNKNKIRR